VSSRYGRSREDFLVAPGSGLVVGGAGLKASVQDAGEPENPPAGVTRFIAVTAPVL
jgi:hypothetical protein